MTEDPFKNLETGTNCSAELGRTQRIIDLFQRHGREVGALECKQGIEIDDLARELGYEPEKIRRQTRRKMGVESPLRLIRLAEVKPKPVSWLWPGRIPSGKLTMLFGDPSLGKSTLTLDIAARVSRGTPWPDQQSATNPAGNVVILSAEDDVADTIAPRLYSAEADRNRIVAVQGVKTGSGAACFSLDGDLPALEETVDQLGDVRLVVIDPISAFLGSKTDSHRNSDVRGLLGPLADFAARYQVAVLAVTHLTKQPGGKAMYRATGSLAFVAAARAGWIVVADGDDPTRRRRLLLPVKGNLAPEQSGLAYRIDPVELAGVGPVGVIAWSSEPVAVTADEVLAAEVGKRGDGAAVKVAAEWLHDYLAAGPKEARRLQQEAKDAQIGKPSLKRASDLLKVRKRPSSLGGTWLWSLPGQRDDTGETDQTDHTVETGETGNTGELREYPRVASLASLDSGGVETGGDDPPLACYGCAIAEAALFSLGDNRGDGNGRTDWAKA